MSKELDEVRANLPAKCVDPTTGRSVSDIDWSYWSNLDVVDYKAACILSRGFEPRKVDRSVFPQELLTEFERRQAVAASHLGKSLPAYLTSSDAHHERNASGVKLVDFRVWGESLPMPFTFPETFPRAAAQEPAAPSLDISRYPVELRAAIEAFEAVSKDPAATAGKSPRRALATWLKEHKPELSSNAQDRVATVANWQPGGGVPKTPGT